MKILETEVQNIPGKVRDLRSALKLLESLPGQLIETGVEVDPEAELSGVYRHIGAGGTCMRPTKEGPAMIFNKVKGHPGARVAIGVLASRKRVAALLDCEPEDLGKKLYRSVDSPIAPVLVNGPAPCQEVVYKATDADVDLYKLVPAPTNTPDDAGPYITLGMCYATHPDTGVNDVTIHRLCVQGKDELSIFFTPGARHIGAMAERAEELGQRLPISISIGVDPYDMNDVLRAMNTRFQGDADIITIPGVHIVPPMLTYYIQPKTVEEMTYHIAAKLLEPFGIEASEYRRWKRLC